MKLSGIFYVAAASTMGVFANLHGNLAHKHLHVARVSQIAASFHQLPVLTDIFPSTQQAVNAVTLIIGTFQTDSQTDSMPLAFTLQQMPAPGLRIGSFVLPVGVASVTLTKGANFGFAKLNRNFFAAQDGFDNAGFPMCDNDSIVATIVIQDDTATDQTKTFDQGEGPTCGTCLLG